MRELLGIGVGPEVALADSGPEADGDAVHPFLLQPHELVTRGTGDGTKTYEWDAAYRLLRVAQGATELVRFTYDGLGRRSQKIAGGVTRTYVYDRSDIIEERLSTGTTLSHVYGLGVDQALARRDNAGAVTYYLADHLGSVVLETNASGAASLTREYDPFGNLLQGGWASGYAFTGRELDAESGLLYYRARYYDSKVGRFISEDPLNDQSGRSPYDYVGNSPLGHVDPLGLCATAPTPSSQPKPCPDPECLATALANRAGCQRAANLKFAQKAASYSVDLAACLRYVPDPRGKLVCLLGYVLFMGVATERHLNDLHDCDVTHIAEASRCYAGCPEKEPHVW